MHKKIKKMLKTPKIFIKDFFFKHNNKVSKFSPFRFKINRRFTVITAIYNSEEFLNDFFKSITTQSIFFEKYIEIICVDDGSSDNSKQIISQWKKKFPRNIKYFYKKNEGQASARNLGIQYAETAWITFIDPDDFVHHDYFRQINRAIEQSHNPKIISAYLIFFMHSQKAFKDTHPLRYRFIKKNNVVDIKTLNEHINLSASSSFFLRNHIIQNNISFDVNVKPNFEDGKFILDYIRAISDGSIIFTKYAKYFYRKHNNSTLDKSWQNPKKFYDIFIYGFLPALQAYSNKSKAPLYVQITVLYDLNNYINYLKNNEKKLSFLNKAEKNTFFSLLRETLTYIDNNTIINYKNIPITNKMIILLLIKSNEDIGIHINKFDHISNQIKISVFSSDLALIDAFLNISDSKEENKIFTNYFNNQELYETNIVLNKNIKKLLPHFHEYEASNFILLKKAELHFLNKNQNG